MHTLLHSVPPALQRATANPHLRRRLLDTHGQVWISLLWGHCSFLLGPGAHKVSFVPPRVFPQSCISFCGSMAVDGDLLQEGLCCTQLCCTQSPALQQSTTHLHLLWRCSDTVLSQSLWGLWVLVCTRYV